MKDLFEKENKVLEHAMEYLDSLEEGQSCEPKEFEILAKEYKRILKWVKRVTKITDKTAEELNVDKIKLQSKVHHDALTGIYNRRYFEEELKREITKCGEIQSVFGLLMMDVDFFKQYNDTYGHSEGDTCLRKISQVLKESIGEKDGFVARYGGEEFVAVLPGACGEKVTEIAESIITRVADMRIDHEKNIPKGYVTISIGGISTKVIPKIREDEYVLYADKALYHSKQAGRDRFTLHKMEED